MKHYSIIIIALLLSFLELNAEKTLKTAEDGFKYYEIYSFGKGTGILSSTGQIIAPQSLRNLMFRYCNGTGLFVVLEEDGWGVISKTGRTVITPGKYADVIPMKTGNKIWICVKDRAEKRGVCNQNGEEVVPVKYYRVKYDLKTQSFVVKTSKNENYTTYLAPTHNNNVAKHNPSSNSRAKSSVNSDSDNLPDTYTTTTTYNCRSCAGLGYCTSCGGTGIKKMIREYLRCIKCGGTGKCMTCNGQGHYIFTTVWNRRTGIATTFDHKGNVVSSTAYTEPQRVGTIDAPIPSNICPDCSKKHRGKCHWCDGTGVHLNSFTNNFEECELCHKTGICQMCHGTGVIK